MRAHYAKKQMRKKTEPTPAHKNTPRSEGMCLQQSMVADKSAKNRGEEKGHRIMNYFWAKTTSDKKPGISVLEHMLNVGFVARTIAEAKKEQLQLFHLQAPLVGALAALHDLGKISPGFQMKCEGWLEEKGLREIAQNGRWDACMESDHGTVTHAALQTYLMENRVDGRTTTFLPAVLGGHHGRLNRPDDRGFRPHKSMIDQISKIQWDVERKEAADAVFKEFGVNPSEISIDDLSPALWWIGGFTSVAD
jgi:CRISPR-associated endonuclease/helicase Cas3